MALLRANLRYHLFPVWMRRCVTAFKVKHFIRRATRHLCLQSFYFEGLASEYRQLFRAQSSKASRFGRLYTIASFHASYADWDELQRLMVNYWSAEISRTFQALSHSEQARYLADYQLESLEQHIAQKSATSLQRLRQQHQSVYIVPIHYQSYRIAIASALASILTSATGTVAWGLLSGARAISQPFYTITPKMARRMLGKQAYLLSFGYPLPDGENIYWHQAEQNRFVQVQSGKIYALYQNGCEIALRDLDYQLAWLEDDVALELRAHLQELPYHASLS